MPMKESDWTCFNLGSYFQGKLGVPGLPGYPGRQGPKVTSQKKEIFSFQRYSWICIRCFSSSANKSAGEEPSGLHSYQTPAPQMNESTVDSVEASCKLICQRMNYCAHFNSQFCTVFIAGERDGQTSCYLQPWFEIKALIISHFIQAFMKMKQPKWFWFH